jgi:thiamine pyrophosphate-dependent acetolactate synthase large subunit-like protein
MVEVIKSLGFEFVAANPGSSFRGLHESIINYGGNRMPELLTCCHEESSVAMAHGYAKIEGKPMMVMAHGTVGLQHASMAVYNAYADRVPVFIVLGNILDVNFRRSIVEWTHSVQDAAAMVRGYTKWDDSPVSLGHFAESAVRAFKIAMTPPMGPVVLVADGALQDEPVPEAERRGLRVPKMTLASAPAAEQGAIAEVARMLVEAENPLIIAGRCAHSARNAAAGGTCRNAPGSGAGPLFPVAHEFPDPSSSLRRRKHWRSGRDSGTRRSRFLAGDALADAHQSDGHGNPPRYQGRRKAHHHLFGGSE